MAYVAVKGGSQAIEQSIKLLSLFSSNKHSISICALKETMSLLIDKVMSEAGFYSPDYGALALKQCEGSVEEAVFLLRAYRSTLRREYDSIPIDTSKMRILRRISASFKDVPGGQILGPTYDYTHRLLDFQLMDEESHEKEALHSEPAEDIYCERVSDLLKQEGVMQTKELSHAEPFDVTSHLLTFPAPRSATLQTLTRSDAGFLGGIAYSSMRGYGAVHPTVSELRSGYVQVIIEHPLLSGEMICVGEILVSEVEALVPSHEETEDTFDKMTLAGGYGLVFGRNENKAISMAIADASLNTQGTTPSQDEEFVLTHGDCLEMSGFISHLKLPHYVTFQSKLDLVREKEERKEND